MSIRDTLAKIKSFAVSEAGSDTAVALLIILVGTGSFGLGRLSVSSPARGSVEIVEPAGEGRPTSPEQTSPVSTGEGEAHSTGSGQEFVVASKTGSKYHFPWCPGAAQIAAANRVQFASAAAARAAGYQPAANCKGLE